MTLGLRVKLLRTERELRQEDVAQKVGMSLTAYRNIESGISKPTLDTIIKLSDFYEVSTDYLLGRNESRK